MLPDDFTSLAGLHLFCNPYSNCAGRVMLAVAEKGIETQIHIVDLLKGEQLSSKYYTINPTCDVPAIVHDGEAMGDSITILRYLEAMFPEQSLTPNNKAHAVKMEELLDLASHSHMDYIVPWIYAKGFGRLPTPKQKAFYDQYVPHRSQFHNHRITVAPDVVLKESEVKIANTLSILEQKLSQQRYLVGSTYSMADIAWFPTLYLLGKVFAYPLNDYPNLVRWMKDIENRPAFINGVKTYMSPIPSWLLRLILKIVRLTGGRR